MYQKKQEDGERYMSGWKKWCRIKALGYNKCHPNYAVNIAIPTLIALIISSYLKPFAYSPPLSLQKSRHYFSN